MSWSGRAGRSRGGLVPVELNGPAGAVRIHLYAAWDPQHHAAPTLAALAARLAQFCVDRYGDAVRP